MYIGIKSMINLNGTIKDYFNCNVGVRQGENLSPFLFSLYINDLEEFLSDRNIIGLQSITDAIEEELYVYLKLFILLYADDTVILAETDVDLQKALDDFYLYCSQWKLNVNKILVFSKGPMSKKVFYYNNNAIENVKEFKYLGIIFSRSGSFCKAKKHLCEQAQKAMYGVIRKIRQFNLPIECQLDFFDKVVVTVPILTYGCEIWGYENLDIIERVHLKFLKHIFHLKSSTASYMVYGETGRFPLYINIYTRMISYWLKLLTPNSLENKIVCVLYKYLCSQYFQGGPKNLWVDFIYKILTSCGFSNIWYEQSPIDRNWVLAAVKQRLSDQFIQKWHSDINNSSKGQIYKIFKSDFGFEKYLSILPSKLQKILIKFRTSNHHLPIETGRWSNIPLDERVCKLCNTGQIADEFHFILECKTLNSIRKNLLHPRFCKTPNTLKFSEIMSTTNLKTLKKPLYIYI
ncbi:uncharacterized protein LOC133176104 [Saccostrea echinata]|uniref:uncharacterized protein LOC133176104 n=1 Tax=Saccostrea echinata TaxID=191078 RepID=UPI002A7F2811|nr:uncharacterized protein LOC133176104 [Saccostrea echinata]